MRLEGHYRRLKSWTRLHSSNQTFQQRQEPGRGPDPAGQSLVLLTIASLPRGPQAARMTLVRRAPLSKAPTPNGAAARSTMNQAMLILAGPPPHLGMAGSGSLVYEGHTSGWLETHGAVGACPEVSLDTPGAHVHVSL